jgi:hypothetical protein
MLLARHRTSILVLLTSLPLFACSPEHAHSNAPEGLSPVSAAELRALLPRHNLRDCDGPIDSGPLIFLDDSTFEKVTGFGNYGGTFEVVDGQVLFHGVQNEEIVEFAIRFFNDRHGDVFVAYERSSPHAADLRKNDENARSLNCTSS